MVKYFQLTACIGTSWTRRTDVLVLCLYGT